MCGIAGILIFNDKAKDALKVIGSAVGALAHRGPDHQEHLLPDDSSALGHARLSIIDTSPASNQPFTDISGNYSIVYNGEIFNYQELRTKLEKEGFTFRTEGDAEVLLNLYIHKKEKCLDHLKGFFSFAVYNRGSKSFFIARDRFGVKPLYYCHTKDHFCFASELRPLQKITGQAKLNKSSLYLYLQLNYLPGPGSILNGIKRLEPGHYLECDKEKISVKKYYELRIPVLKHAEDPAAQVRTLLTNAVRARLVSDVPVGAFLSGGLDSTIITGLASQFSPHINTFSIGFRDNAYYDESEYARIASKKFKTRHHDFLLSNEDLLEELDHFFNAIDEPFADSSALNVFILSKRTRQHVKVVLSGDGADEVFAGYNKHRAEWMIRNKKLLNTVAPALSGLSALIPQSRNSALSNKFRQVKRYNEGRKLDARERYWKWASISTAEEVSKLLPLSAEKTGPAQQLKKKILEGLGKDYNTVLKTDVELVLAYDMLTKVDMMSMANGLEVRSPFMDHELIEYAFSLGEKYKINSKAQKIILKKAFADLVPEEIRKRKKHGFEVPLQNWFHRELRARIENDWLEKNFIHDQGIFNYSAIERLKKQVFSSSPGDAVAKVWALIVFNEWWKKTINS
ncbi:MAG: asparagine synthase (glutamine-hydrolyzing) [Bacteroidia bacterium]